jgi:hypothetical protein
MYVCITCICIYTYVLHVFCVCMYCLYCMYMHGYFKDLSQNTYIYIQIPAIHANTQIHTRYLRSPNLCICLYILTNTCQYRMECFNTCNIHTCIFTDVVAPSAGSRQSNTKTLLDQPDAKRQESGLLWLCQESGLIHAGRKTAWTPPAIFTAQKEAFMMMLLAEIKQGGPVGSSRY